MTNAPADWYDDGSGRLRWWDGTSWTEHFADTQPPASTPAEAEPGVPQPVQPVTAVAETPPVATPSSAAAAFLKPRWIGVGLLVIGAIVVLIGRAVYYSDPYYNNTTDPVGIGLMVAGGAAALIGLFVTSISARSK